MNAKYSAAAGIVLVVSAFGMKFVTVAQSAGPVFDQVRVIEDIHAVPGPEPMAETKPVPGNPAPAQTQPVQATASLDVREQSIIEREKAVADREDLLKAYETKVKMQLDELKRHRDSLAEVRDSIVGKQTEDVRKLAFMYGNMKARDAAEIMAVMPIETIVRIIDGMSDVQATALLGALAPETAKEVTRSMLGRALSAN